MVYPGSLNSASKSFPSVCIHDSVTAMMSTVSVATRHRNSGNLFLIDLAFNRIIRRPLIGSLALRIATRFPGVGACCLFFPGVGAGCSSTPVTLISDLRVAWGAPPSPPAEGAP
jgi:hypothetical protein